MISFVVPAYNEEHFLGRTLASIRVAADALCEPYEVIVADDGSTDATAAVAASFGTQVVSVQHRQIAATRNSGARKSSGEFLIFIDADTVVNETVVRAAVDAMRQGAVGGGSSVRFDGRVPLYARILLPVMVRVFRAARLASGCFLFCTRNAFERVGGFDETLFGSEELTMSRALKRVGRFVVLRQEVITSGRKLRQYSGWQILATLGRLAIRGPKSVRTRDGLEIWYAARRDDSEMFNAERCDCRQTAKESGAKEM